MTAGGRSPNAAAQAARRRRPPGARRRARPGRRAGPPPSGSGGWPACRCRARGQVPPQVVELVRDRAEDPVVVEPGLADGDDPRVGRPADDPRPAGVVDLGGVVRVDADRGVEPGEPVDAARARARDEATFQPGTRIRSRPASRARAEDLVGVALEPVGVEVAVAVDEAHRASRRARRPTVASDDQALARFDVEAREERLGRRQPAGLAGMGAPGQLVEDRRAAVAVRAVRVRVARAGRGRAARSPAGTARRPGRAAGTPRRGRRGRRAAASPAVVVAGLRGLGEHPRLLGVDDLVRPADELPQLGQRLVEEAALERLAVDAAGVSPRPSPSGESPAGARRGPLAVEIAVGHRHRAVDEVAEVVGEVGVVAADERVPARPRRRGRTAPRAAPRSARRPARTRPRSRPGRGSCRGSCSSARRRPRAASRGPRRGAAPRARRSTASPARRSCGTGRCPCR